MQISRHWRMNATRYRLEGVRNTDGHVALQAKVQLTASQPETHAAEQPSQNTRKLRIA